ncbi:serine hydrolase domain-containing protein [Phytomonospora sp. NPDC050363]|uniref:serine hydrolase domain-containing protein n=1 Tax=Phytomonospora sp. NPDC050363 TaxID=3155642 RepID=UPI0033F5DC22
MPHLDGLVAPGFEAVADAFHANFTERETLGAAVAVTLDGRPVVDLWGGVAAPGIPWCQDTATRIFSGGKALVAVAMLMLVDDGRLDPHAPVAKYWPEFAAEGKGHVTVAEVMSHRARLPAVRGPVTYDDQLDPVAMAARLAAQPQERGEHAVMNYHGYTIGWLADAIMRRVDGRSIGGFVAQEIAGPLGLDAWIGVPRHDLHRVADVTIAPELTVRPEWTHSPEVVEFIEAIWWNPPTWGTDAAHWNTAAWKRAEIPGVGAIATPRAMARFYGALARGGELDGVRLLSPETLAFGRTELGRTVDVALGGAPLRYGFGLELEAAPGALGPVADAFGHAGAGGSIHVAWPSHGIGVSYAMNDLQAGWPDRRRDALLNALLECVA